MESLEKIYLFSRQKNREGIILDTNVLLLSFIGKFDPQCIIEFEPTHHYTRKDYELLLKIIRPFKKIYVTPQIVAEFSNLSKKHLYASKLHSYFALVVDFFKNRGKTEEAYMRLDEWSAISISRLCMFGFVDLGTFELSKKLLLPIVTDEIEFYNYSKDKIPIVKLSVVKYSKFFPV